MSGADGTIRIDTTIQTQGFTAGMTKMTNSFKGFFQSFVSGGLQTIFIIGSIIKAIIQIGAAVAIAVVAVIYFAERMYRMLIDSVSKSDSLFASLSTLGDVFNNLKGAFIAAFATLLMAAMPVIMIVINALVQLLNWINMVIAALSGQTTYMQYVAGSAKSAADSTGNMAKNTAKAKKEAQGALAAFDQINVLAKQTAADTTPDLGGGGGVGGGTMQFKQVAIDPGLLAWWTEFQKNWTAFWKDPWGTAGQWLHDAWDNVFVPWANQAAIDVAKWCFDLWPKVIKPKLEEWAPKLFTWLSRLWPDVYLPALTELGKNIGIWWGDLWTIVLPKLQTFSYNLGVQFDTWWPTVLPKLQTFSYNLGVEVKSWWDTTLPKLQNFSYNLGVQFGNWWQTVLPKLQNFSYNLGVEVGTWWDTALPKLQDFSYNLGVEVGNWWRDDFMLNLSTLAFNLGAKFSGWWPTILPTMQDFSYKLGVEVGKWWKDAFMLNLSTLAFNLGVQFGGWWSTVYPKLQTFLSNLQTLFLNPIETYFYNMGVNVGIAFGNMIQGIIDKINEAIIAIKKVTGIDLGTIPPINPPGDGGGGGGGCFIAGTLVTMANGTYKPIEEVQVGDLVLSWDTETNQSVIADVCEVFHHEEDAAPGFIQVNGYLGVTPEHMMFINRQWAGAAGLKLGDRLIDTMGQEEPIWKLEVVRGNVPVYNLHTSHETHNYFAGGVLVHNVKIHGAAGLVIPPNAPFAALLGDQRSGTNIEAPADLIRQIVREEMQGSGGGGDLTVTMPVYLDGTKIYENQKRIAWRKGMSLISGGSI